MRVGVFVLTYNAEHGLLRRCLDAILDSEFAADRTGHERVELGELLVLDNASPTTTPDAVVESIRIDRPGAPIRYQRLPTNTGFAGGTNHGLRLLDPSCDAILLCNPDAVIAIDAIELLGRSLLMSERSVVSVAPKMLLAGHHGVIDAVGNCVNVRGEGLNLGLGQPDLGQFDAPMEIFGPCFGAALIRRSAFQEDAVGLLDERLFLYYEDVDWNWRARLLGFRSVTEPRAVVTHQMSSTVRHLPYDFKFRLTERNLLLCAAKNMSAANAVRSVGARVPGLILGALKGHFPIAGMRAVAGFVRYLPSTLRARRVVQRRRVRTDDEIVEFGRAERIFFDSVTYELTDRSGAELAAKVRLASLRASGGPE